MIFGPVGENLAELGQALIRPCSLLLTLGRQVAVREAGLGLVGASCGA